MKKWWKQLWCIHQWRYTNINYKHYDFEEWFVCAKCGKTKDVK